MNLNSGLCKSSEKSSVFSGDFIFSPLECHLYVILMYLYLNATVIVVKTKMFLCHSDHLEHHDL